MPVIPKGFATKLGVAGAALLAVVSALTPFISGADSGDTQFYAALASGLAAVTILGRMLQAAAQFISLPSPAEYAFADPDLAVDVVDPDPSINAPSEHQLKTHFQEDAPPSAVGKAGETS